MRKERFYQAALDILEHNAKALIGEPDLKTKIESRLKKKVPMAVLRRHITEMKDAAWIIVSPPTPFMGSHHAITLAGSSYLMRLDASVFPTPRRGQNKPRTKQQEKIALVA